MMKLDRPMTAVAAVLLILAGAAPATAAPAAAVTADAREAETARLTKWLDAEFETALGFSPMTRTQLGDKKDNGRIDDYSPAGRDREIAWRRKSVADMKAKFDRAKLSQDGQVSYDLWAYEYGSRAADAKVRQGHYPFFPMFGPQVLLPRFLMQIHKVDDAADMDAYVSRIRGVATAERQLLASAKANAAAGVRLPRFAYDAMLKETQALAGGAPFDGAGSNVVWADAQAKADALAKAGKISAAQAEGYKATARKALLESWGPAYREIAAWLETDRPNSDAVATGVGKNPGGPAFYAVQLAQATTTDMTPDQVHQLGLSEVVRIKREMETIKDKVGFKGSLQDFFKYVSTDGRFYEPNTDAGRQGYIDKATAYITELRKKLPQYFGVMPKAGVVVKRVEAYREQPGGAQHYMTGAPDGSRPGVFYAHLSDMKAMPLPQLEAIAHHEATLGHHLQFSIAQEQTGMPRFRQALHYNAFQEGWGVYTEGMAKEMGAYQDPYSDFGRLTTELWRAIRLVTDTGVHSKGWTEEQAVQYFKDNSPMADGQIRSEVQRYIVWPAQATGYKIGQLKILEMRAKAQAALGDRFDIRGFHDTLLKGGQMTLPVAARRVDEWIATQSAGAR